MNLISIVVPVYNVQEYLEQCVKSLTEQTYRTIEIILVDDGSTDCSGKLCDELALQDARIKVIHKKNEGLGLARNTGLKYVTGKYVAFMDSDDYADEDMIELLYNGLKADNVDTCIGGFKKVDCQGNIMYDKKYNNQLYTGQSVYNELFLHMLGSGQYNHDAMRMSVWNALYSADIIKTYHLEFPSERVFISEDIIFDSDYYRFSKGVQVVTSTAYNYRTNPLSLSQSNYRPERFKMMCVLQEELERRLQDCSCCDMALIRLRRQFFVNVRSCIHQENPRLSEKTFGEALKAIRKICENPLVRESIEKYPVHSIQWRQKIFLRMVQHRCTVLLLICTVAKFI